MATMRPDEILLQPLPSPIFPNCGASTICRSSAESVCEDPMRCQQLNAAKNHNRSLKSYVIKLSEALRRCYPKRIQWPVEQTVSSSRYCIDVLVSPVVQLFSQLRAPSIPQPLQFDVREVDDDVAIVSFPSDDFPSDDFRPVDQPGVTPKIIFMPHGSLNEVGTSPVLTGKLSRLLRRVWSIEPQTLILCSDLDTLIIFHPPSPQTSGDVVYERSMVRGDLVRLRIIIAAYLYDALPVYKYIYRPPHCDGFDIIPEGSPIDPSTPMQTDEEVFASHHRHSDFDFFTLARDPDRGLQFFRWKENIKKNVSPIIASPGDVILGMTNGFSRNNVELSPYYPAEDIPSETANHIQSVKRSCPMGSLRDSLLSSENFTLRLLEDITPSNGGGVCRTYKCDISSIGGQMEDSSPVLCLKLFDDRFFRMETPSEELIDEGVQHWWTWYRTAEHLVRNEDAAYKKLELVQGSLIPWFYGSHLFTLPDGHRVYGILMEFVPAQSLSSGVVGTLSPVQQMQLIHSTRHAVRALQYSDVSQHDWHSGQILCNVVGQHTDHPDGQHLQSVHCVLVDFSSATQSVDGELHRTDDFGHAMYALGSSGLSGVTVWNNFGQREFWDLITVHTKIDGEPRVLEAADPYEFLYEEQLGGM